MGLVDCGVYLHTTALNQGAFNEYIDRHNYGYVLRKADQVQLATYDAQMIYHLRIPDWDISLKERTTIVQMIEIQA